MHIGIILDGNRRYAKKLLLEPWKGHSFGAQNVRNLLSWCITLGVKELTLYCFSLENFKRSQKEVEVLMSIFLEEFKRMLSANEVMEHKARIRFIGRKSLFSQEIQDVLVALEKKTEAFDQYVVNFALGYSGRDELVQAVQSIVQKAKSGELDVIDEQTITDHVQLRSEPDMVIRTSGELRLSGFLPWQSTYSELYFTPKLWPEFTQEDLKAALEEYKQRQRRYGK